jgi:hypothetical protein
MGAEQRFYVEHYAGGVEPLSVRLDDFAEQMIGPGKRYDLA